MDTIKPASPADGEIKSAPKDLHDVPPSIELQEIYAQHGTPARQSRSKTQVLSIVVALYLVTFIAALDQTVIATAIPTITSSLHSASGYTWLGGAYLLANAVSGPIWTKGSDIWGRKLALLGSVLMFAIASLIAALSKNMRMLIATRAMQGTAGGGLFQLVSVTISDIFSLRERALYFGLMGGVWAVAGSAGPVIGGALSQFASWRWCFWINLPVCFLCFVLLFLFLDVHNPRTTLRAGFAVVDWPGIISFLGLSLLLLLGLNFGGTIFPWNSPAVICLLAVGACMVAVFLYSEKRANFPLMPLGTFKILSNNAVILVAVGHSMLNIGAEYYLPLFFQSVKGASPIQSGILLLPLTCTAAATDIAAGYLIHKTGRYREVIWAGVLLMTLGSGLYVDLWADASLARIIGFQIIAGTGTALLFQTPMLAIHCTVPQDDLAAATSSLGFLRALATSVSVVVGGVVFQNGMQARRADLAAAGIDEPLLEAFSGEQAAANVGLIKSIVEPVRRQAAQDAFAWSIRNIFILYTAVAAVTVVASCLVKQGDMNKKHTETKTGIEEMKRREE